MKIKCSYGEENFKNWCQWVIKVWNRLDSATRNAVPLPPWTDQRIMHFMKILVKTILIFSTALKRTNRP